MNRRDFLKSTSSLLAVAALRPDEAGQLTSSPSRAAAGRLILPMNRNWRFNAKRAPNDTAPGFDDFGFEQVTIPHNQRLPWHSFDEKSYEFVSIYRRHFKLPAEARGRHVFADFGGAMTASTVWLNGQRLGEYKGGYTPFSFELTPHLNWDGENLVTVELDSSERSDIPPFGGDIDYLTFGGIYRDVALRVVPATYLENIFAKPKDVLSEHPAVDISCFVAHLELQSAPLTLEAELRDGERVLAAARVAVPAAPATTEPVKHNLTLTNLGAIQRWELSNPRLFTVIARIRQGNTDVDEDRRRVGS